MTNRLTEQQLQEQLLAEFDAIDKFGRGLGRVAGSAAKGIGAVAGGVAGIPSAIKKGYDAGKQTVGGGGSDMTKGQTKKKTGGAVKNTTSQTKSAEYQRNRRQKVKRQKKLNPNQEKVLQTLNTNQKQQLQTLDPTVQDQILNKGLDPNKNLNWFQKAVGAVDTTLNKTFDKVDDITSYDWRRGLSNRSNQDYVGAYGYQKLGKNKKQQIDAKNKIDKATQQAKNKSGIGKGIADAEKENKQKNKNTDRQTAIDNLNKFKNRNKNKEPTKTKTDIEKKIRIGNQLLDPSDPKNAEILKQVNKKTGT